MATDLMNLSNELTGTVERAAASIAAVHARRGIGSSGIAWRHNLILTSSEGVRMEEGTKILTELRQERIQLEPAIKSLRLATGRGRRGRPPARPPSSPDGSPPPLPPRATSAAMPLALRYHKMWAGAGRKPPLDS